MSATDETPVARVVVDSVWWIRGRQWRVVRLWPDGASLVRHPGGRERFFASTGAFTDLARADDASPSALPESGSNAGVVGGRGPHT